jgi:hypothetical protein
VDSKTTYENSSFEVSPHTWISYSGGFNLKYNFADIQSEVCVPFAQFAFSRTIGKNYSSISSNNMSLGFGLNWFLVRNLALTPVINYSIVTSDHSVSEYNKKYKSKDTSIGLSWGLSSFI